MITIHVQRTAARTYCGLDPREPPPEGSRCVSEAKYRAAAERFAAGTVPGACDYCLVQMAAAKREEEKEKRRKRRRGP